jgi:hypothetical protein
MGVLSAMAFYKIIRAQKNDWKWGGIVLAGWYVWFVMEIMILGELNFMHAIWGIPVMVGIIMWIPLLMWRTYTDQAQTAFLLSGFFSSVWLATINWIIPGFDPAYDISSQTVSELSAIGASTRVMWILAGSPYAVLVAAFGWGLYYFEDDNRWYKVSGLLVLVYGLLNVYWPPMHLREAIAGGESSISDTLHIVWTSASVALFIAIMFTAAMGSNVVFRIYTTISVLLLGYCGFMTSRMVPLLETNQPTPGMGLWERCNIALFLLWISVLSITLAVKHYRLLKMKYQPYSRE